ncbi:hypothetical protein G7046_g4805 [Stylonectria norvegica]|nr:hypothetical protein G7046_g4805 [Stylonectria norvegica]
MENVNSTPENPSVDESYEALSCPQQLLELRNRLSRVSSAARSTPVVYKQVRKWAYEVFNEYLDVYFTPESLGRVSELMAECHRGGPRDDSSPSLHCEEVIQGAWDVTAKLEAEAETFHFLVELEATWHDNIRARYLTPDVYDGTPSCPESARLAPHWGNIMEQINLENENTISWERRRLCMPHETTERPTRRFHEAVLDAVEYSAKIRCPLPFQVILSIIDGARQRKLKTERRNVNGAEAENADCFYPDDPTYCSIPICCLELETIRVLAQDDWALFKRQPFRGHERRRVSKEVEAGYRAKMAGEYEDMLERLGPIMVGVWKDDCRIMLNDDMRYIGGGYRR